MARPITSRVFFARASGDKILLIHDDDALTADCLERLLSPWNLHPDLDIVFADQYEMDHTGKIDLDASAKLNLAYHRTPDAVGLQPVPGRTGLVQMMPNNGWLANAELVKKISYKKQYGMSCDFVFGTEMCLAAHSVLLREGIRIVCPAHGRLDHEDDRALDQCFSGHRLSFLSGR